MCPLVCRNHRQYANMEVGSVNIEAEKPTMIPPSRPSMQNV